MTRTCSVHDYPFSEPHALELDPSYARLRAEEPLARIRMPYGGPAWLATRHADVRTVLGDRRFSREAVLDVDVPRTRPESFDQPGSILTMDPPEHSRLRRLVAKAFTVRRVEALRPRAEEITAGLLETMAGAGAPADLVRHLSVPLPVTVICELLGVPASDRAVFRSAADAALSTSSMTPEARERAREEMNAYLAGQIARRRARPEPGDDLLGALVAARDAEDRLSEEELVGLCAAVLIAGHETTMSQLGNITFTLLSRPERWEALKADPDGIPRAVEELLRFIPLGASAEFPRVATEDVEVGGVLVRRGEAVVVAVHAANRDPEVFAAPDDLDFTRAANPHVAFGHGAHHCLGAQLARMELQVALRALTVRFPGLRLAGAPADVAWRGGALVRGPRELLVSW